jgi:hypothetical protein
MNAESKRSNKSSVWTNKQMKTALVSGKTKYHRSRSLRRPGSVSLVILKHFEKLAIEMHTRGGGSVLFPEKTH